MKKSFGFINDESNFFIIDKKGTIRLTKFGKVDTADFGTIRNLIKNLAEEI